MKNIRQNWPKYAIIFFLSCMLSGISVAYAAPSLWSYPNDHLLISEVNYAGLPGATGTGTEWVEIYNPSSNTVNFDTIYLNNNGNTFQASIPTRLPVNGTITPYEINDRGFIYLAYDAAAFYSTFNQCPDFANMQNEAACPNVEAIHYWQYGEIADLNGTLCMTVGLPLTMVDAIGWGVETPIAGTCQPMDYPLPNPTGITYLHGSNVSTGIELDGKRAEATVTTYLRGDDVPTEIGPGGEGAEIAGTPASEQLGEVWNLSSDVDVPWEGAEAGQSRQPTAIKLQQNPHTRIAQNGGYLLSFFGFIGLALTLIILVWRQKPNNQPKRHI